MDRRFFIKQTLGASLGGLLGAENVRAVQSGSQGVVWSATHETGDLSEWTLNGTHGGAFNSGAAVTVVSTDVAHSGRFSCKMTIDTSKGESGCRQFRHEESRGGEPYYYGIWIYIPIYYAARDWWNVVQFKSKTKDRSRNDPVWVMDLLPRQVGGAMHLRLRWKGLVGGPSASDTVIGLKHYDQDLVDVPVGRWFHLEVYLKQSDAFDGRLTVWQDGVQLWDMVNVKTKYVDSYNEWSVNNYSDNISPTPTTIYIDDATVSTRRLGVADGVPPNPPTGLQVL